MLKRILIVWLVANFVIVGLASLLHGGWYIGWTRNAAIGVLFQLGLVQIWNLVLPLLVLRFWWTKPMGPLREALGWQWHGWRTFLAGVSAFILVLAAEVLILRLFGSSIPYSLPGTQPLHSNSLLGALGLLLLIVVYVGITVAGEETMFRGLMQTQLAKYGFWTSLLLPALLFGLRHLPDDIFYGALWHATPQMWLSRQLQLYVGAILFGLARHYGRSTYASAILHGLVFFLMVL